MTNRGFVCVYDNAVFYLYFFLFCSTHLDDVRCNDKLRRFAVTLFTWGAWGSQSKDPFHLVFQTLFAWLLIHCWMNWSIHRLGLISTRRKQHLYEEI